MSLTIGDYRTGLHCRDDRRPIEFHDWVGDSWGAIFSHPKDFTPVCTTDSATWPDQAGVRPSTSRSSAYPSTRSTARALGDGHRGDAGHAPNFPMIGDPNFASRSPTGCCRPWPGDAPSRTAADNQTVRNVFVVGPDKKIKLLLLYPMTTGRNFDEILRVIDSLQLTAKHQVATPANWKQGEDVYRRLRQQRGGQGNLRRLDRAQAVHPDRPRASLTRARRRRPIQTKC